MNFSVSTEHLADQIKQAGPATDEAWDELYPRIKDLIHHLVTRVVRSTPTLPAGCEYDDLVQIAQVQAFECARRFDGSRGVRFTTYLYHYVLGAVKNHLLAQGRAAELLEECPVAAGAETGEARSERFEGPASANPVDIVFARDTVTRLAQAMKSLPPAARLVCQLRFFDEGSIDDIARKMNPQTVKSHIRRSRAVLMRALTDEAERGARR